MARRKPASPPDDTQGQAPDNAPDPATDPAPPSPPPSGNRPRNSAAADELRSFIERKERIRALIAEHKADEKDLDKEISGRGFDVKALDRILKERAETDVKRAARREREAITEVYRAALGMLDGTPLGDAARDRLMRRGRDDDATDHTGAGSAAPREMIDAETIAAAREAGRQACRDGARIIDNPHVAGDPRRAAWDEGWCAEAGSDGMDIPAAFRRAADKDPDDKPPAPGPDGDDGDAP